MGCNQSSSAESLAPNTPVKENGKNKEDMIATPLSSEVVLKTSNESGSSKQDDVSKALAVIVIQIDLLKAAAAMEMERKSDIINVVEAMEFQIKLLQSSTSTVLKETEVASPSPEEQSSIQSNEIIVDLEAPDAGSKAFEPDLSKIAMEGSISTSTDDEIDSKSMVSVNNTELPTVIDTSSLLIEAETCNVKVISDVDIENECHVKVISDVDIENECHMKVISDVDIENEGHAKVISDVGIESEGHVEICKAPSMIRSNISKGTVSRAVSTMESKDIVKSLVNKRVLAPSIVPTTRIDPFKTTKGITPFIPTRRSSAPSVLSQKVDIRKAGAVNP
jgi:hypothetical protein